MHTCDSLLTAITADNATASETREVLDPATGARIAHAPVQNVASLEAAIDTAQAAQPAWAALSDAERSA